MVDRVSIAGQGVGEGMDKGPAWPQETRAGLTIRPIPQPTGHNVELTVVLALSGEMERANYSLLTEWLTAALDFHRYFDVILEASELEFIDSTGLGALITASRHAARLRSRIVVAAPTRTVRRAFEVTLLTRQIPITNTVEEALTLPVADTSNI